MLRRLFRSSLVLIGFLAFSSLGFAADVYAGERVSKEMVLKHFVGPTWLGEFTRNGRDIKLKYKKGGDLDLYEINTGRQSTGTWKVDDKGILCMVYVWNSRYDLSTHRLCGYYEYSNKPPGISPFIVYGGTEEPNLKLSGSSKGGG